MCFAGRPSGRQVTDRHDRHLRRRRATRRLTRRSRCTAVLRVSRRSGVTFMVHGPFPSACISNSASRPYHSTLTGHQLVWNRSYTSDTQRDSTASAARNAHLLCNKTTRPSPSPPTTLNYLPLHRPNPTTSDPLTHPNGLLLDACCWISRDNRLRAARETGYSASRRPCRASSRSTATRTANIEELADISITFLEPERQGWPGGRARAERFGHTRGRSG